MQLAPLHILNTHSVPYNLIRRLNTVPIRISKSRKKSKLQDTYPPFSCQLNLETVLDLRVPISTLPTAVAICTLNNGYVRYTQVNRNVERRPKIRLVNSFSDVKNIHAIIMPIMSSSTFSHTTKIVQPRFYNKMICWFTLTSSD